MPSSAGCGRTSWTSARSIVFRTSRCGRTDRCSGTSCGSGWRCGDPSTRSKAAQIDRLGIGHRGVRLRAGRRKRRTGAEPVPLSGFADRRGDGSGLQAPVGRRDLSRHRHPVPAVQYALSALRRVRADPPGDRGGRHGADDSRPVELLADRIGRRGIHQCHDDAVRGCAVEVLGEGTARCARHSDEAAAAARRAGRARRPAEGRVCQPFAGTPVVAPACHDTGSAVASVAAGRRRAFLSSGTWSLLGAEVERRSSPRGRGS